MSPTLFWIVAKCTIFMLHSVCVLPDPPREIEFDVPSHLEVGATYKCSADANPPVSSYVWTLVPSGMVLSTTQTLTLTESLVIGKC